MFSVKDILNVLWDARFFILAASRAVPVSPHASGDLTSKQAVALPITKWLEEQEKAKNGNVAKLHTFSVGLFHSLAQSADWFEQLLEKQCFNAIVKERRLALELAVGKTTQDRYARALELNREAFEKPLRDMLKQKPQLFNFLSKQSSVLSALSEEWMESENVQSAFEQQIQYDIEYYPEYKNQVKDYLKELHTAVFKLKFQLDFLGMDSFYARFISHSPYMESSDAKPDDISQSCFEALDDFIHELILDNGIITDEKLLKAFSTFGSVTVDKATFQGFLTHQSIFNATSASLLDIADAIPSLGNSVSRQSARQLK